MRRILAIIEVGSNVDGHFIGVPEGFYGLAGEMGTENQIIQLQQFAVCGQRFDCVNIQTCTADLS